MSSRRYADCWRTAFHALVDHRGACQAIGLHHCCRRQEAEIARVKDFLILGEIDTLDWVSGEDIGGLSDQEDIQ